MFYFEDPTFNNFLKDSYEVLYVGILSSGLAFLLQTYSLQNISPAPAAIVFSLEGVFAAILGVGKTFDRLVKEKNQIVSKKILPISLSYDHRLIDGAEGARFCVYLGKCLGKDFAFKLAV